MPTKADRRTALPAGLIPLLSQRELETYYGVSDWTVLQWIEDGMPVVQLAPTGKARYVRRRFDLAKVDAWHAERAGVDTPQQAPSLQSA
jgi:phage terminase Nu1 subunit (DNA packaging protein)